MKAEQHLLSQLLANHYGKQAVLIGSPAQFPLLNSTPVLRHTILTPLAPQPTDEKNTSIIETDFHELPLLSGSVDLVILPHTLEFIDNPQHLLAEACRVIKPEGLIAICGINPYSLWGLKKWMGHVIPSQKVQHWLSLNEFVLEKKSLTLYQPSFIKHLLPFMGSVYVLIARAKVIPMTPIRLKWKQQLSSIRLSTSY
jgi:SAM-dependent methyltransferase